MNQSAVQEAEDLIVGFVALLKRFDKLTLAVAFFYCGLCGCETGNRHAEWAAGYVVKSDLVEEFYGGRITAMLTTNAQMNVRAGCSAELAGHANEFTDTGLVNTGKWVVLIDLCVIIGL